MEPTQLELPLGDTFDPVVLVREFMDTFEPPRTPEFWIKLIDEEDLELGAEIELWLEGAENDADVLKEACDVAYVIAGFEVATGGLDYETATDERFGRLLNNIGFVNQLFSLSEKQEAFRRVHASNMSKLGDDGKPIRREDGKVLKGPNYKPADLSDLV